MFQRVFNSFFGGIYSANLHRGHARALSDAALVTAAWLSFVVIALAMCVVAPVGFADDMPQFVVPLMAIVVFSVVWLRTHRKGDLPLSGPRLNLDSFIKKRAFGIGCIMLPLAFVVVARMLAIDSFQ